MGEGGKRKSTRETSKRPFVFKTPQKVASPFIFTKKQRREADDGNDDAFYEDESMLPLVETPSKPINRYRKAARRKPTPEETAIRARLIENQEHHRLQMFDTLCTHLHKRILAHTASHSSNKETCTKKQVAQVLEKAAAVIKEEFASNEPIEEEERPELDTVQTIIASLEEKLQVLLKQQQEWSNFLDNVPNTLKELADAAPQPSMDDVRPAGSRGNATAQELIHEQNALCQRVLELKDQLRFLDISIEDLERMMSASQATRSSLFDTFHESEFKGYAHMQTPKEAIKALMALFS
ncbi:hypothetical protein THRCLA_02722 [Thraustotheca clavata]|uniref:Uncharacterized protein n=1 Tax=Thraustotheca clavata TaxID=74557 RepID=A0A1W0A479_9STRA|nr:hypothetical protein THRCLA_02722 [Thraustotheca clavata]